jgi:two-component system, cell cycle response regulator CpdR
MTTVLLVEDEADVRELIVEAFAEHGLEVVSATTDEHAYRLLEEDAKRFAILVADINLGPGTTGFDVARRARRLNGDLKVVYITGHAAHLGRFGVDGALMFPKPFNPHELAERVKELLR